MIKKIILGVLALIVLAVAGFCVAVAMQPSELKVTRSAVISAPPEKIFEQVNDFHKWEAWSPWEKLDPAMKKDFSGSPSGKGASYHWVGNDDVGEGRMTIAESHPSDHIKIDLDFIRPFAQKSVTDFNFKADGDKTNVTWTMTMQNGFISKAFGLLMDMDKMLGADFEKGLAQMKITAEAAK
ncbi:MAG: SRPBCC family protein [Pyrinomonadaceae bacterium]